MSLYLNTAKIDGVHVGTTPATAVYLGGEKVWPIYVGKLSVWYNPTANVTITALWPDGAEFCDAIMVGGGAGGTGTGISGNAQRGGGEGPWSGVTIKRTPFPFNQSLVSTELRITCVASAGSDGAGGGNFSTEAADGSFIRVTSQLSDPSMTERFESGKGLDKTSNTGNRNGGNVAAEFVFNGRTYTMASYGTNAGRGGATSNKNGGDGNRPGGGGQSADNGGLTGYNGGNGAHGAAILYWY